MFGLYNIFASRSRSESPQPQPTQRRGKKRSRSASATPERPAKKARTERSKSVSPGKPLRIGILITYPRLEVKKEELISHRDKNRPWNKLADSKFVVQRKFRREKPIKRRHPLGKYGIPTDVAVGCYIKHAYQGKNVEVDMIQPHEISEERLQANDINFLMIYDDLEAFHTDKSAGKKIYKNISKILKDDKCNVYPPKEYRDLIYSKIKYYNYLKANDIAIAPTLTMTSEEYNGLGAEKAVSKIMSHAIKEKWDRFICKPVYGMEGIDARFFELDHQKSLKRYLERCMKKYPGIVFQKEIPDFGNSRKCPELRMYYVGNKYQYSACANDDCVVRPRQEGGGFDTPLESLKRTTRKILKRLPEIVMNGKKLPRLLTRLDMGYIINGNYSPFVNEVEFVPSLYSEDCAHHPDRLIDARLGDQMVKITKIYTKSS